MVKRHIIKKVRYPKSHRLQSTSSSARKPKAVKEDETKKEPVQKEMDMQDKIEQLNAIMQEGDPKPEKVKKVKRDKSLIERAEGSKVVMTDDNKMLLND